MSKPVKTLIVSPHIDDDVLGCYSFLQPGTVVCYMGVEDRAYVSANERIEELKIVSHTKGFSWQIFENCVNKYEVTALIPILEEQINKNKPVRVFIPHYSYNQDHQAVYNAAMIALRPHDQNWFVNQVFVYEQPHTVLWPVKSFTPNYFIKIDVEDKIRTYKLYKSQVRKHRSPEIIRTIASLRGSQCNLAYAEAYSCIRFVSS